MVKVVIFHNVGQQCQVCGRPVAEQPDGQVLATDRRRRGNQADCQASDTGKHQPMAAFVEGYKHGHALVRVFETDYPSINPGEAAEPFLVAEVMFEAFNAPEELLSTQLRSLTSMYQARQLRSLSVGDLVQVGDVLLACGKTGWTHLVNEVTASCHGTKPWDGGR